MTDHSNPITDILVKAITDFVIMESKGTADTENVKARIQTAAQALYEAVKGCVPGPAKPKTDYDKGWNDSGEAFLTNLSLLFGVDLGSSQDPKQLKAQGHEADNLNAGANHG